MKKSILYFVFSFVAFQSVAQNCPPPTAQIDLDVNNVRAKILNGGDLWLTPGLFHENYEVPIGSGLHSMYSGSFWIGGFDAMNQLMVAAQSYRQAGNDFWPGPISTDPNIGTTSISLNTCGSFDTLFPITKAEVMSFVAGGLASSAIQTWPGNGDVTLNQLPFLAPFFDANNDGIYNFIDGDYPYFNLSGVYTSNSNTGIPECDDYLYGDKSIWWVFNDIGNIKTESNTAPIGLEIRAQAFAYSSLNTAINNATFYKYQIINRGTTTLFDTHAGMWLDAEIGNENDDYVGCDVSRSLSYVYNAFPVDTFGYGALPPAAGLLFLQGPFADINDNFDNNRNGWVDEPGENCLMNSFIYFTNTNNVPTGNPGSAQEMYQMLNAYWCDNTPIFYGGDGRGNGPGATTSITNFAFPNTSDPSFSTSWTMYNSGITPHDMRFVSAAGPFILQPGEVNYLTTSVVWARSTTPALSLHSVPELLLATDVIQNFFDSCFGGNVVTGINTFENKINISISPNPFRSQFVIDFSKADLKKADVYIYSISGQLITSMQYAGNSNVMVLGENLNQGVYLISIRSGIIFYTEKIIKLE